MPEWMGARVVFVEWKGEGGERVCLLKIPRGDINGVGGDEVTVTSGFTRKQKEQTNKERREGYIRWRLRPRSGVR